MSGLWASIIKIVEPFVAFRWAVAMVASLVYFPLNSVASVQENNGSILLAADYPGQRIFNEGSWDILWTIGGGGETTLTFNTNINQELVELEFSANCFGQTSSGG